MRTRITRDTDTFYARTDVPGVARKMVELKEKIFSKIDQKFNELKLDFLSELKIRLNMKFLKLSKLKLRNVKN